MDIDFKEFEENYMGGFDGWVPVWSEYEDGVAAIEMVVHWRIGDGKYKTFEIEVDDQEQLDKLKSYLERAGEWWKSEMLKHSERFITFEKRKEDEDQK